jgi:uncharacterized protein YeaO (DUF488 family)
VIKTKRIYDQADPSDGYRILVDRLWPRGLSKERAKVDSWLKEIGPSDELRKWFQHDPEKWSEFRKRFFDELASKKELTDLICEKERTTVVTLLYGSKEERYNNAQALKEYLTQR